MNLKNYHHKIYLNKENNQNIIKNFNNLLKEIFF